MAETRYLRKRGTNEIFVWTPTLEKRTDMVEVKDPFGKCVEVEETVETAAPADNTPEKEVKDSTVVTGTALPAAEVLETLTNAELKTILDPFVETKNLKNKAALLNAAESVREQLK
ncbi:MAG: hypothetical protein C0602_00110 [Denitrovibrio sp.]|nr:MAG: hypothetical protein C0602_00110 [Denitrovibrio sp.]